MKNENSTRLNPPGVAWDAWLTEHGGSALVAQRQRERLAALVAYARDRSPLYADRYAGVPQRVDDIQILPWVTRYLVCTTSGSSGTPAILVLDHRELAVMNGLGYARALSSLLSRRIVWADGLRRCSPPVAIFWARR